MIDKIQNEFYFEKLFSDWLKVQITDNQPTREILDNKLNNTHILIRGVLIQSFPAGAKNFTNYVFCHVQFSGVIQNIENHCAIKAKLKKLKKFYSIKLIILIIIDIDKQGSKWHNDFEYFG